MLRVSGGVIARRARPLQTSGAPQVPLDADPNKAQVDIAKMARVHLQHRGTESFSRKLHYYLMNMTFRGGREQKRVRQELAELAAQSGVEVPPRGLFTKDGWLEDAVFQAAGLDRRDYYLEPAPPPEVVKGRPESANEYFDPDFAVGTPLRRLSAAPRRREYDVFRERGAVLYADSLWYQAFSADEHRVFMGASPMALGRSILGCPAVDLPGDAILIGDIFNGRNISHFTLCWLNRVGFYLQMFPDRAREAFFIVPSRLNGYAALMLAGMAEAYGLDTAQFILPDGPCRFRPSGYLCWFSDSGTRPNSHPAHLLHANSVEHLRRFATGLRRVAGQESSVAPARRLYISRADAATRKVVNEEELWRALEQRGFTSVALGHIPPADQVRLMSEADFIVASHGAGLTHLAFAHRNPRVIEIFKPGRGTDAYVGLGRAMGCRYQYMLGEPAEQGSDFAIDVGRLTAMIDDAGAAP